MSILFEITLIVVTMEGNEVKLSLESVWRKVFENFKLIYRVAQKSKPLSRILIKSY